MNSIIYANKINIELNNYLKDKNYTKIFILLDENIEKYCLNLLSLNFKYKIIKISSGENNKNLDTIKLIWENLLLNNADRHSLLINLGGGVISDMGGFCASTYQRGIDFINIPTTLLAQVDATIGGKTGFNLLNKKNMIGLFNEPKTIFIDINFLKTLTKREFLNGIAEALKHGLLFDMEYFYEVIKIVQLPHPPSLKGCGAIVKKSIDFKKQIVEEDYNEKGLRKVLNLGHTIESYFIEENIELKHGEAVVMGIISELYLSHKKFNFDNLLLLKIISSFKKIYTLNNYTNFDNNNILKYLLNDKKNKDGKILMVLLKDINKPIFNVEVTENEIKESLDYLKKELSD
jgi:3-dehydroquinate synthase